MSFWLVAGFYIVVFGSICGILLWYYFYTIRPFSKFPSARGEIYLIQGLFNKEKITTFIFQKLIFLADLFQNEGLFVAWIFKPYLIIFNEEDIKNVLNHNIDKATEYKIFREAFGDGLFISDEALWRKRRKMFNPVFRTKMVIDKIPIFNKYSVKLVQELTEMQLTTFVDAEKLLKGFSFNVIYEAITGISLDNISIPEKELIFELANRCAAFINQRPIKPWFYFMTFFAEGREFQQNVKKLDEITSKHLMKMKDTESKRNKREKTDKDNAESTEFNKSFAEVMLEHHAKDLDFTVEDMLSETKLFISGGFGTVSTALNWCLFLLGKHPKVQDRVHEEMAALVGDLSFEDLQHLAYMDCVIMETLRLYPPIPIIGRSLKNEMQCGKYRIPKGTTAVIFLYMHQRNPKDFLDPNKFDPDRFLDGNLTKSQWMNFAFSAGIRNCIGQKFAMLEMKTVLVHILRKFKIVSHDEIQASKVGWEVLLKAEQPLLMKFIPRRHDYVFK